MEKKKRTHIFYDEVWTFDEEETRKHKESLERSREVLNKMSVEEFWDEVHDQWDEMHDRMMEHFFKNEPKEE